MKTLDHDRLVNADPLMVSRATMAVASGVQDFRGEAQVLGAAAFFLILCETMKVPAQDAFVAVKNLMASEKHAVVPQFNAARQYIEKEIVNV